VSFVISFMDEYSRYIVHHEVLLGIDGITLSLSAQKAIETLPRGVDGMPTARPVIQSDNGSGYIAREYLQVLKEHGLGHHRIKPHCPEENGVIERSMQTLREALEGEELPNLVEAQRKLARVVRWYNEERLHSALGYLRQRTTTAAIRQLAMRSVVTNWSRPGIAAEKETSAWSRVRWRSKRRKRLLPIEAVLCQIG
jgi:transposase InsO family protein